MPTFELTPAMMREIIMDHYSSPRHKCDPEQEGYVSLHSASVNCIDDINVYLKLDDKGIVEDARWNGVACAISTASSDILCDLLIGKNEKDALYLNEQFHKMLHEEPYDSSVLEEAMAFMNTSKQAARIHCATIGWDAMEQLLKEHRHDR
ncbi:MAG: SUF system NifU family Fe-S cluster assembly protein [Bacilli bacterium]|nr:SUF system NifU family Fe-S cluster assembly protein [Bacilli bacterium]